MVTVFIKTIVYILLVEAYCTYMYMLANPAL